MGHNSPAAGEWPFPARPQPAHVAHLTYKSAITNTAYLTCVLVILALVVGGLDLRLCCLIRQGGRCAGAMPSVGNGTLAWHGRNIGVWSGRRLARILHCPAAVGAGQARLNVRGRRGKDFLAPQDADNAAGLVPAHLLLGKFCQPSG